MITKIFLLLSFISLLSAQEKNYYFYHPENDYGTESMFNPVSLIINGGFDVLRNGKNTKDLRKQAYAQGIKNVWKNLSNPIDSIEKFTWKRFLTTEVFPVSTDTDDFQYFPNYANHLIGHGLKYVRAAEWYDYHGYASPYIWSVFTTFTYAFINEVVENGNSDGVNVDPIADMLIFNPLGILLFSTDWAREFFSESLPMYDWSLQPVLNPFNFHLENTGEQYVVKYGVSEKYDLFFYWGTSGILGVSYGYANGDHISAGAGGIVNRLIEKPIIRSDFFARYVAPETIDGAIGIFYDRNHSLLASLIISGPVYYNAWINIFPGLLELPGMRPGLYLGVGEISKFQVGITFTHFPLGIGAGGGR